MPDDTPEDLESAALRMLERAGDSDFSRSVIASGLRARAAEARARAESFEALAERVESGRLTLPTAHNTVNAMTATAIDSNSLRSRGKIAYPESKFLVAMTEDGETIPKVAAALTEKLGRHFHRNTVQGWYVPVGETAHRDIPRAAAEALRDRYGKYTSGPHKGAWRVPVDSWPRVKG